MSSVPRIIRLAPKGPINRPPEGIPVLARIRWHHGPEQEVAATAIAWSREAVEITWELEGDGLRSDWIPANDVHRYGQPAKPVNDPPRTLAGRPRARW